MIDASGNQRDPPGPRIQAELRTIDRAFEGIDLLYLSIYLSIDPSSVADLLLAKSFPAKPLRGQRLRKSFEASSTVASTVSSNTLGASVLEDLWRSGASNG